MRNVYGWSAVALMCLVGSALAQNEAQPLQPGVGQQPRSTAGQQPGQPGGLGQQGLRQQQAGQHGTSDQQIAAFLLACCRNEIEISKFAQDRLQSQEAKAFAEKMVREHTPGCEQLAQMAGPLGQGLHVGGHDDQGGALRPGATRPGQPGATQPRTPGADRPGIRPGTQPEGRDDDSPRNPQSRVTDESATFVALQQETREGQRPGAAAGQRRDDTPRTGQRPGTQTGQAGRTQLGQAGQAGQAGQLDWNEIHRQIADRSLQGTKEELERHDGHEFDRAYLGQQLLAHGKVIAEMEVLKDHASQQLQQLIDNELELAKQHKEEARRLMDQLSRDPSVRTARQPGQPGQPGQPNQPERRTQPQGEDSPRQP